MDISKFNSGAFHILRNTIWWSPEIPPPGNIIKILMLRMTNVILVIFSIHCVEKIWIIVNFYWEYYIGLLQKFRWLWQYLQLYKYLLFNQNIITFTCIRWWLLYLHSFIHLGIFEGLIGSTGEMCAPAKSWPEFTELCWQHSISLLFVLFFRPL